MKPEEIRALRLKIGLTQEKFAELVGVSFVTVNGWENSKQVPNQLSLRTLRDIAFKHKDREVSNG